MDPMIRWILFVLVATWAAPCWGASTKLLEDAVARWLGERDHWAFTQRAIEYENGQPRERLERYDPSLPGNRRWHLLALDGKPPTDEQRAAWEKRKFRRKPRRFDAPLGDYFDFAQAKVLREDAATVQFSVPLRTDKSWLFPVDKVDVTVTVSKETRALEQLSAHVREPFRVLLGIARITGGSIDLNFDEAEDAQPSSAQPTGTAQVSVSRFGERVDFTWSDFKRVTPHRDRMAEASGRAK
jgi:hypothetical protein